MRTGLNPNPNPNRIGDPYPEPKLQPNPCCKGFESLKCTITLDTDATDEKIAELKAAVDAHCPLAATLKESVPVSTTITQVNTNAEGVEAKLKEDPVQAESLMAVINAGKEDDKARANPKRKLLQTPYTRTRNAIEA